MELREIARKWLELYNKGDAYALGECYHENAINDRVADSEISGRDAIVAMYRQEFAAIRMEVRLEQLYEAAPWIIMEWVDQSGFRGCVFFRFEGEKIIHQRSYWDTLTYRQKYDLPSSIH